VARWIKGLPKPLGLMACNDFRGVQALDACRRAEIAVPEEVAVIGADNEVLACELAYPPLSSVIPDCARIGYEAAALLDRFMRGGDRSETLPDVAPLGIATRQSTDMTAIDDPCVAEAVRFIREHAHEGIGVEDILNHMAVSRSVLQRRFQAALGRTVHDLIAGLRLKHVKQLLVETDLTLPAIADRTGFNHVEYLCSAFRKATGITPGTFRNRSRHSNT
jgi:LacI family transcriptional regulator